MLGANKMRQISIAAIVTAVVVALFGASAMVAHVPHKTVAASASSSIDLMKMTINAKGLPVEQFDAN
jgi:type IV secretory pathway protease TraF